MTNTATITIPAAAMPEFPASLIAEWMELIAASHNNKEHQAILLITVCIEAGFNRRKLIREAGHLVGLDAKHIMIILNHNAGRNPERHLWQRSEDGFYSLHP
jgi:hypothetical protein